MATLLTRATDEVDSFRLQQDDGSEWLLLPNLELRQLKPPSKRRAAAAKRREDRRAEAAESSA